jgi:hypothetical protein
MSTGPRPEPPRPDAGLPRPAARSGRWAFLAAAVIYAVWLAALAAVAITHISS